ncbi:MAG: AtpZ/AtpI family protein [Bacteroidota bacterium]
MSASKKKPVNNVLKYSGMAVQMAVMLMIGTYLGSKLDERFATEQAYFTALFAILFLGASLYLTLKDFIKNTDES